IHKKPLRGAIIGRDEMRPLIQFGRRTGNVIPAAGVPFSGPELPGISGLSIEDIAALRPVGPRSQGRAVISVAASQPRPDFGRKARWIHDVGPRDIDLLTFCAAKSR